MSDYGRCLKDKERDAAYPQEEIPVTEIHVKERVWWPYPAFTDRLHAGEAICGFVNPAPQANSVVLALPRGGVPVGEPLSEALGGPLNVALVRKLPIPVSPEMGFGAVAVDGSLILNDRVVRVYQISNSEIESVTLEVIQELLRRGREYLGAEPEPSLTGKQVYVVDDGLATGYTAIAAAKMALKMNPRSLKLCVPVSPSDSLIKVEQYFDEIFCLVAQEAGSFAVASFYRDFHDMSDDEVREILIRRRSASHSDSP